MLRELLPLRRYRLGSLALLLCAGCSSTAGGRGGPMQAMVVPPGAKPVAIRSTGSVVTVVIALESRGTVVDFKADDGGVIQLIHENSAKGLMLDVTKTHRELLQKEADWMKFECDGYTTLVALDFTLDHPLPFDPKAGDKYSGQLLIPYREDGEKNPGRCELLVLHD